MSLMPSILLPDVQQRAVELLKKGDEQLGVGFSDYQHEQLLAYLAMIVQWNRIYNLTAIRNPLEMVKNHLLDSMAVVPLFRQYLGAGPQRLLDVGAGAGLPGMVLAIAEPAWQVSMIDAVQKKTAFIQQAVGQLRLANASVIHGRVEALEKGDGFNIITSRAFSSQRQFVGLAGQLLATGGLMAAMKGKLETDPGDDIPDGWTIKDIHPIEVPGLSAKRHLITLAPQSEG